MLMDQKPNPEQPPPPPHDVGIAQPLTLIVNTCIHCAVYTVIWGRC